MFLDEKAHGEEPSKPTWDAIWTLIGNGMVPPNDDDS